MPSSYLVSARNHNSTSAKSGAITNVIDAGTWDRQRNKRPIDGTAFMGISFGSLLEEKMHKEMNYAAILKEGANKLFHYGLDRDKVPYAQKSDGTKGRYVNLSPNHFKLQIIRGRSLGEVEFTRLADETLLTKFKTAGVDSFSVRASKQISSDSTTRINISFQYKNKTVALQTKELGTEKDLSRSEERQLGAMVANIRNDQPLKDLMRERV